MAIQVLDGYRESKKGGIRILSLRQALETTNFKTGGIVQ
jgi:hypothetical protein